MCDFSVDCEELGGNEVRCCVHIVVHEMRNHFVFSNDAANQELITRWLTNLVIHIDGHCLTPPVIVDAKQLEMLWEKERFV
jgi:hypothetical protein